MAAIQSVKVHRDLLEKAVGKLGMPENFSAAEVVRWCLAYVAGDPNPSATAESKVGRPVKHRELIH